MTIGAVLAVHHSGRYGPVSGPARIRAQQGSQNGFSKAQPITFPHLISPATSLAILRPDPLTPDHGPAIRSPVGAHCSRGNIPALGGNLCNCHCS